MAQEQPKNFYEELEKYFSSTPREKVLADWEKSKEHDKVGPTVDEFLAAQEQPQRKGDGWEYVIEKERKSEMYLFTTRTALELQDAYRDKEVAELRAQIAELKSQIDGYILDVSAWYSRAEAAENALIELIQVKDWKDKNGKDEHYEKAQPLAWENARKVIENLNDKP